MKGKGIPRARNLQFVLLNYFVEPKTIEFKCSSLNGSNFGTLGRFGQSLARTNQKD